jgi:hypothetical protein
MSGRKSGKQSGATMWTDEKDAALREWTRDGVSAAEQAKRLGVSRNAVLGRRFRMGLRCGEPMRRQLCADAGRLRAGPPKAPKPPRVPREKRAPSRPHAYPVELVRETLTLAMVAKRSEACRIMGVSISNLQKHLWPTKYAHLMPDAKAEAERRLEQIRLWNEAAEKLARQQEEADQVRRDEENRAAIAHNETVAMPARVRDIMRRRIMGETLQDIADHFGFSRERVRQLEAVGIGSGGVVPGRETNTLIQKCQRKDSRHMTKAFSISSIPVESNIPPFAPVANARIEKLRSMSPGDSILVPKREYVTWKKAEKEGGFVVLTRKAENDQIRIWRVA